MSFTTLTNGHLVDLSIFESDSCLSAVFLVQKINTDRENDMNSTTMHPMGLE